MTARTVPDVGPGNAPTASGVVAPAVSLGVAGTTGPAGSRPTLETTVHTVVARQLRVPPDDLTLDLDLVADLGLDDDAADLLLSAVEEALDVRFPDDFLEGLHTYGDLAAAVRISLGP